jgi:hypothetical protein
MDKRRRFPYYIDIALWIVTSEPDNHAGCFIEVNGPSHDGKNPFGRKHWAIFQVSGLGFHGWDYRVVTNEQCAKNMVQNTARKLVDELVKRANEKGRPRRDKALLF